MAYKPDFEHPTTELLHWLEENLFYYQEHNNEEAISVFRSLLQETKEKMGIITRSNEQTESTQRPSGISYMVQCALGGSSKPNSEHPQEERASSGFQAMLTASSRTEHPRNVTLTRAIDESQFPTLCNPMLCPPNYARHCSANTPEHFGEPCIYHTPTNEQIKHPEPEQRATLPELLETLETEVWKAENSAKNEHIIPNKPNFFKPKNPDGSEE
jgi:hypothetical protein